MSSVAIIIPARYQSSRFPGKPLADILGKPMIQHVYEKAVAVAQNKTLADIQVVVATDDERILSVVQGFGGIAIMTSSQHASGTDRLVEVMSKVEAELYINLQGDEPLVRPADIELLIDNMLTNRTIDVGTLCHPISAAQAQDPNRVKVVTAHSNRACYFSRAPIPYPRDAKQAVAYKQHVGVYGYRKAVLDTYSQLAESEAENIEQLEQLRLLDSDIDIHVFMVEQTGIGVDTPEDLQAVIAILEGKDILNDVDTEEKLLSNINLVITDVDGVLTDGTIYYDEHGESVKGFNVKDGLGIKLLQQSGVEVAVLSGRDSKPLRKRLADLGVTTVMLGVKDKYTACQQIISQHNTQKAKTAYIGDDSIDLPAFAATGLAVAVADAPSYIKAKADLVLDTKGGRGAFRDFADKLLIAQDKAQLLGDATHFLAVHTRISQ